MKANYNMELISEALAFASERRNKEEAIEELKGKVPAEQKSVAKAKPAIPQRVQQVSALLLRGAWLYRQAQEGQRDPIFSEIPGWIQEMMFQSDHRVSGLSPDTPALFPRQTFLAMAPGLNLGPDDQPAFRRVVAIAETPLPATRKNAKPPKPQWEDPPNVMVVHLPPEKKAKVEADKLAGAIRKLITRRGIDLDPIEVASASEANPETAEGKDDAEPAPIDRYLQAIEEVSPDLAKAFNELSVAYIKCPAAMPSETYMEYFTRIPVLPPQSIRQFFKNRIWWRPYKTSAK